MKSVVPDPKKSRLRTAVVAALRERYIANEWATQAFPEQVADTVLDAVPEGWKKDYDGGWLHNIEQPFSAKTKVWLGEWLDWTDKFPFEPVRKWRRQAQRTAEGYIYFQPPKQLVHNRFIRARIKGQRTFDDFFGLTFYIGKRGSALRFNIGSFEVSLAPIPKKEWRET